MRRLRHCYILLCFVFATAVSRAVEPTPTSSFAFDIEPQPLVTALQRFGEQTGRAVFFFPLEAPEWQLRSRGAKGEYTEEAALAILLEGVPVEYEFEPPDVLSFHIRKGPVVQGPASDSKPAEMATVKVVAAIPDVLKAGSPSLNADIERTPDDASPFIVFDREKIERSGARDLSSFIRGQLPAHHPAPGLGGGERAVSGEADQINMRGMGYNQTVVLIDGRRVAGRSFGADPLQTDLAGIPLASVERVEVLPATASARFGGGAIAATVNIVLRRGEPGTRLSAVAEQTAGVAAGERQLWMEHVREIAEERGRIAVSGAWSTRSAVSAQRRNFLTEGRKRIEANNPGYFDDVAGPPLGAHTNVRSANDSPLLSGSTATRLYIPDGFSREDGLDALAATQGRYDFDLAPTAQAQGGALSAARPALDVKSLSATGDWNFTSAMSADIDLSVARITRSAPASGADFSNVRNVLLPASAPTNAFRQAVYVTIPVTSGNGVTTQENTTGGATGALELRLAGNRVTRLEHTWSMSQLTVERPMLEMDPGAIASGRVDVLRHPFPEEDFGAQPGTLLTTPVRSATNNTTLQFAGPALAMPAGEATVTFRAERRLERLADGTASELFISQTGEPPRVQNRIPEQRQTVESLYAELNLPLIPGAREQKRDVPLLDGQFSVHRDSYRTDTAVPDPASTLEGPQERSISRFQAVSWMVALRVQPTAWFMGRASCGTGFLPPSLLHLTPAIGRLVRFPELFDPARGFEPVGFVNVLAGGNPTLEPEHSRSCTAGIVLRSAEERGLRFSADYTRIRKTGIVFTPSEFVFTHPQTFLGALPDRVRRAAPTAGEPWSVGPVVELDASSINLARREVRALDVALDYTRRTAHSGDVQFSMLATWQPQLGTWKMSSAPELAEAAIATVTEPRYRVNASVSFTKGDWSGGWSAAYMPRYVVSEDAITALNQGSRYVRAQHFHNVFAGCALPAITRWDTVLQIRLDAHNVFRRDPSFDAGEPGYASRYGLAEIPDYALSVRATF